MRSILQISTHTTVRPRHGGQLRSHYIGRIVETAGFNLKRLAVAYKSNESPDDPSEPVVDVSESSLWWKLMDQGPAELNDLFSLRTLLANQRLLTQFEDTVRAADPSIIMLEHPWMWPALKQMDAIVSGRTQVIYNSQNVEAHLKRRILSNSQHSDIKELLSEVDELEKDLVRHSAATTVCTAADGDEFVGWGAKRVVVAGNGAVLPKRDHLIGYFPNPLSPQNRYGLVVGSDHPPNLAGLQQFIAPALMFLRPFRRIVVAGGVSARFDNWLLQQNLSEMAKDRLVLMGSVGQVCLDSLIVNASVILLPIPYGGGSNVKTAEALLSGRRIVATSPAMRGFREFMDFPGVAISDDQQEFFQALMTSIEAGAAPPRDEALLHSLLWQNTLAPIIALLRDIESINSYPTAATPTHALSTPTERMPLQ